MKKNLLSLIIFSAISSISLAQESTVLKVQDTREINDEPGFMKRGMRADFKRRSVIGILGAGNVYSGNITIAPWADVSGGPNYQLNFSEGGLHYRLGYSTETTWKPWIKILVDQGDQILNGKLHVSFPTGSSLRIGQIGDRGNISVPVGAATAQYNIDFTGYRDNAQDQVGARIAAIRFNNYGANNALIQNTGLAFYTNPVGTSAGITDLIERMRITPQGNIGIGTATPDQKLTVKGKIHAQEVLVDLQGPLADYVFKPDYQLMPLAEVEQYVNTHNHLPEVPSATEVAETGLNIGEMQNKLLQKIEELTLYVIAQEKRIKELEHGQQKK